MAGGDGDADGAPALERRHSVVRPAEPSETFGPVEAVRAILVVVDTGSPASSTRRTSAGFSVLLATMITRWRRWATPVLRLSTSRYAHR